MADDATPRSKAAPRWRRWLENAGAFVLGAIASQLIAAFADPVIDPIRNGWRDFWTEPAFQRFQAGVTSCRDLGLIIDKARQQRPGLRLAPRDEQNRSWREWLTKQTRICVDLQLTASDAPTPLQALRAIEERLSGKKSADGTLLGSCFGYQASPADQPAFYVEPDHPHVCITPFEIDPNTNRYRPVDLQGDTSGRIALCLGGRLARRQEAARSEAETPKGKAVPCAPEVLKAIPDFPAPRRACSSRTISKALFQRVRKVGPTPPRCSSAASRRSTSTASTRRS